MAPDDEDSANVPCRKSTQTGWAETLPGNSNADFINNVSCMAQLGTDGCGMEQQLQAGIRALLQPDQVGFIADDHLLLMVYISDEEDCSIEDRGLFATVPWNDGTYRNTACNYPETQETNYLFSIDYFYDTLLEIKDGRADAVIFSAIVGVPPGDVCEGTGDELNDCLAQPEMEYVPTEFVYIDPTDPGNPLTYTPHGQTLRFFNE